jgi:hypothetical protein
VVRRLLATAPINPNASVLILATEWVVYAIDLSRECDAQDMIFSCPASDSANCKTSSSQALTISENNTKLQFAKCSEAYRSRRPKHLRFPTTKGLHMSNVQWEWQEHYLDALIETNPLNLGGRVAMAERAILLCKKELRGSLLGPVERRAIADAINALSVLRRENKASPSLR